jgi:hypothetical protein
VAKFVKRVHLQTRSVISYPNKQDVEEGSYIDPEGHRFRTWSVLFRWCLIEVRFEEEEDDNDENEEERSREVRGEVMDDIGGVCIWRTFQRISTSLLPDKLQKPCAGLAL